MKVDDALIEQLIAELKQVLEERDLLRSHQERLEADLLEQAAILARERNLLDSLLTSAGEAIYGTDRAGLISFVNPAAEALFGYSAEELLGKAGHSLLHRARADGTPFPLEECPIHQTLLDGQVRRADDEVVWRKDGVPVSVTYVAAPVRDAQGALSGVVTLFEDVTERKRIARLHAEFIEGSSNLFVRLDAEGRFTYLNPAAERVLCCGASNCLGQSFFACVHAEDVSRSKAFFEWLVAEGIQSRLYENRVVVPDGNVHVLLWAISQHMDAEGSRSFICIGRDISERKRIEERLKENQTLLQTLIDALPDIVCFKDGEGRWLLANRADLALFRLEGVAYQGKTDAELAPYSPFFQEPFLTCMDTDEQAWQGGVESKAEEVVPQPDAPPVILETIKVPLFYPDGSRKGLVIVGRDVTERKRMEEERLQHRIQQEKAHAELETARQVDRLKTNFVNGISHDLRAPLTSIMGYAEFLEDELEGTLTPGQREYVAQIAKSTKRLELMVDDLLDCARMEAGSFMLNLVEEDLRAKMAEVVESLRPRIDEAGLAVDLVLPPDPLMARMDGQRIERVITNLLTNAIKFTPSGGRIVLRAREEPGRLVCEVEDSGIGIAPDDVPRLFQRFTQLEAGVGKGGTGLGLSIIKAFVEAHGGTVGVLSKPGVGSTFWFTLPAAPLLQRSQS